MRTGVSRRRVSISILVPFLVFILFFSSMLWQKYRSSQEVVVSTPPVATEASRPIILFFVTGDAQLARESRVIDPCENDTVCLKRVIEELLNGPVGGLDEVLPEGTIVESVRIEGTHALVEFSNSFVEAPPMGSSTEMLAVYSVVNTVAANFPYIQDVKLNIGKMPVGILHHLDLSEPLPPDFSLEKTQGPFQ